MRVLLVFPPIKSGFDPATFSPYPPLGLLYVAAATAHAGHEVSIVDCIVEGFDHQDLKRKIEEVQPDVVGISALSSTRFSAFRCAEIAKECSCSPMVVMGGPHPTWLADEIVKRYPSVDVVVRGEGEVTFPALLEEGISPAVDGISYMDADAGLVRTPDRQPVMDLDSLPLPAYHLVPMDKYFKNTKKNRILARSPSSLIFTARGCTAKCIYCSTPNQWKKLRYHSPEYVIGNIKYLVSNWGVRDIRIFDDTFPVSPRWMKRFHQQIREQDINVTYSCFSRVNIVTEEVAKQMKETGCYYIQFGIESGSPETLQTLRKFITIPKIKRAFSAAQKAGIFAGGFFMFGFPGEGSREMMETVALAKSIPLSEFHFANTLLMPGTELSRDVSLDDHVWFEQYGSGEVDSKSEFPPYTNQNFTEQDLVAIADYANYQALTTHCWRRLKFHLLMRRVSKIKTLIAFPREIAVAAGKVGNHDYSKFPAVKKGIVLRLSAFFYNIARHLKTRMEIGIGPERRTSLSN